MNKLLLTLSFLVSFICLSSQVLALPSCPSTGYFNNCFGAYIHDNGDKYLGEWKDDKYHGQGTFSFIDGDKYVGGWKDDKYHGQGTFHYKNGDTYVGEFKNDKYHGQGTLFVDGDKHTGEYINNQKNGFGTYTYSNGNKYIGEFKNDKINGQGTFFYASGEKQVGEFKNEQLNGYAVSYNADGTIDKQGLWKDDEFLYSQNENSNQYISLNKTNNNKICPNSDIEVWNNCFGIYSFPKGHEFYGDRYEGMFKNDTWHGQGTYYYGVNNKNKGDKYIGEFKGGAKDGLGSYYFLANNESKGDKYVGQVQNNKFHGHGTYTFSGGDKYEGKFKNDLFHGQGAYYFSDGRIERGEYKNDKLNGYAVKFNANGTVDKKGIWKDDEFQYAENEKKNEVNPSPNIDSNKVLNAASGTGFAVSSKGHVVTNHHVIDGCQSIKIHFKGKVIPTTVINFDPGNDVALLKGDFTPSHILPLSNDKTELLQDIFVAGYPFGNKISTSVKVTKGIISSLTGIGNNFSNFQIDAALQPGNSGGPILNNKGNVIGVAVAKLDRKYIEKNFGVLPENTNFGIKTSVVKSMLNSSDISLPNPNKNEISKSELGKNISNATYYLSCWMTMAQIEKAKSNKVVFKNLEN